MARISGRELVEWMILEQIEPWGERRADLRAGMIAATIANVHRDGRRAPYQPAEFVDAYLPAAADRENVDAGRARALRISQALGLVKAARDRQLEQAVG